MQSPNRKPVPRPKRPTNVSLDGAVIDAARALGINVSQACEQGLRDTVAAARERQWRDENRAAIDDANGFVEEHGLPLSRFRQF